jgi:excisionase family DNA binding protein
MAKKRPVRHRRRPATGSAPIPTPSGALEPLLGLDDVAELCGVARRTVDRWVREGRLRGIKLGQGKQGNIRFHAAYVRTVLELMQRTGELPPAAA